MQTNKVRLSKAQTTKINNLKLVKNLLLTGVLVVGLAACSSDSTPDVQRLTQNVLTVSSTAVLSVISEDSYLIPDNEQPIVQAGRYKVVGDIYDESDNRILIPSGAILSGVYSNDGDTCFVTWKSVYANNDDIEDTYNAVSLSKVTRPTKCNPARGVRDGDRLKVSFTDETD